jgi:hypothetical protein
MILNYYQAIELMSFLPVLLTPIDAKVNPAMDGLKEEEVDHTIDMTPTYFPQLEVNGQLFY